MTFALKLIASLFLITSLSLATQAAEKSLVEKAVANPQLSTLVAALKAADLVDVLAEGDFTVLAPTNAAFEKVPAETLSSLLLPKNKAQLQSILKFHLLPNGFDPANMLATGQIDTIEGRSVEATFVGGRVRINNAVLLEAGNKSPRGTIHLIDTVLLPPPSGPANIVETAIKAGTFKTLVAAAKAAGLVDALTGDGPLTVFAPTDDAFAALPKGTVATLLKPENKAQLARILKYHVVAGKVRAGDALNAGTAATLEGNHVEIGYADGGLQVGNARVLAVDVEAANGIIHVIDAVLMPPQANASHAISMIERAIAKGVPTYNHGNIAECARIYMSASKTLMRDASMPAHATKALTHAVRAASKSDCHDTRAWTLREGLDVAYLTLLAQKMSR